MRLPLYIPGEPGLRLISPNQNGYCLALWSAHCGGLWSLLSHLRITIRKDGLWFFTIKSGDWGRNGRPKMLGCCEKRFLARQKAPEGAANKSNNPKSNPLKEGE